METGQRSVKERLANRNLPRTKVRDRRAYLLQAAEGRRVLHLGCVDWPYLEQKLADGTLIHAEIAARASRIVGLDSDAEGVEVFQRMGWACVLGDVEDLPELDEEFDLVIAGEIIEHLANPGRFLTSLAARLPATDVVITTPNAYAARRYWRFLLAHEQVHPDHVAYYSPLTLRELLLRHSYTVDELQAYEIDRAAPGVHWTHKAAERLGVAIEPWTADGIIVSAKTPAG